MTELLQKIIALLKADSTLTAVVAASKITTGPVDITMDTQASLNYPQINIHVVSEVQRSVPLSTRDTQIQIDIWSRNNQMEVQTIYERILADLSYQITDQSTAHIFWMRLSGSVDDYESDRRVWHRAVTYVAWTLK
jgi:hypothetical protein